MGLLYFIGEALLYGALCMALLCVIVAALWLLEQAVCWSVVLAGLLVEKVRRKG